MNRLEHEQAAEKKNTADTASTTQKEPPKTSKKSKHGKPARNKAHQKPVAAAGWVLKSAKPGEAWVAKKGSNDLREVYVGDTLTGVGRVTSIMRDSFGRWVVLGKQGRISQ